MMPMSTLDTSFPPCGARTAVPHGYQAGGGDATGDHGSGKMDVERGRGKFFRVQTTPDVIP